VGRLPQAGITQAQDGSFCHDGTFTLETSIRIFGCPHRHQADLLTAQLDHPQGRAVDLARLQVQNKTPRQGPGG
jgi:hypothetical protein